MTTQRAANETRLLTRALESGVVFVLMVLAVSPAVAQSLEPGTLKLSTSEKRQRMAALAEDEREFLRLATPIMTPAELDVFLMLESDGERDEAVSAFWTVRAGGAGVEKWKRDYTARFGEAGQLFGDLENDRAQMYLLRGRPAAMMPVACPDYFKPVEVWSYETLPGLDEPVNLLFFREKSSSSPFRLLTPTDDERRTLEETLLSEKGRRMGPVPIILGIPERPDEPPRPLALECPGGREVLAAIQLVKRSPERVADLLNRSYFPRRRKSETRTITLESAESRRIPIVAEVSYPGKRGGRTVTSVRLSIDSSELTAVTRNDRRIHALRLRGEVIAGDRVADRFRYDFELPAKEGEALELVIERFLAPRDYELTVHLQEDGAEAEGLISVPIDVPYVDPLEREVGGERTAILAEMEQQFRSGESSIRIVPLGSGFFTGKQRFDTLVTGDEIESVDFYVGDQKVMSKRSPPYALELDLGNVPTSRTVRVIGRNDEGRVIAGDQLVVNGGSDPFRVRIVSPRISEGLSGEVRVEVVARVPSNHELESLELFLNDERVAIGYESPLIHVVGIPSASQTSFLRAVATIGDEVGSQAEDVVLLNAPEMLEQVDVRLVELPTTVIRNREVVDDLEADDFEVLDEGKRVAIEKFEYVRDLPLAIGMAIDSSGSMTPRMSQALKTGAHFFQRVLKPGDRAFLLAFSDEPAMVQEWTDSLNDLTAGLASLDAAEMTALHDAVIHSLYNFQGLRGQKALVLLSDGQDTASNFGFKQVLEYARRSGVPIYTIGLGIRRSDVETRAKLVQLAEETGGSPYFIEGAGGLGDIYHEIELELRSQYILGFYPSAAAREASEWREIEVTVDGASAKTVRGYYP